MAELNGLNEARCGCRINTVIRDRPERELVHCPTHGAAFTMLAALEEFLDCSGFDDDPVRVQAKAAVDLAKERR